jgi:hypothetical protein
VKAKKPATKSIVKKRVPTGTRTLVTDVRLTFNFPDGYDPDVTALISDAMDFVPCLMEFQRLDSKVAETTLRLPIFRHHESKPSKHTFGTYTPAIDDPDEGCGDCEGLGVYLETDGNGGNATQAHPDAVFVEMCDQCGVFMNDYDAAVYYYEHVALVPCPAKKNTFEVVAWGRKAEPGW